MRLLAREQDAAVCRGLGLEQPGHVVHPELLLGHAAGPVRRGGGDEPAADPQKHGHPLEAERLADALAGGAGDALARHLAREPAGDAQQLLDVGAVAARGLRVLGGLDRQARLRGDSDEYVELAVAQTLPAVRLVDGQHAQHHA